MSLDIKYVEFSIVLAANSNNPTILNPDFLKYNKIVDETFELKHAPICTEPFAQLSYKNGLTVTSQLDKIIFSTRVLEKSVKFGEIADIVRKYVCVIPHVEYTGLGINPSSVLDTGDNSSEDYIINNFFKIEKDDAHIFNTGLNFSLLTEEDATCNIKIKSGKMPNRDEQRNVIIVNANFHHELAYDMADKIEKIIETINLYRSDIHFFENNVIQKYFKEKAR